MILGNGGPRHVETVRALVAVGADVNIADRDGLTPLQDASARGYSSMVSILQAASKR